MTPGPIHKIDTGWALSPFVRSVLLFCILSLTCFCFSPAATAAEATGIELTPEEQAWLNAHPVITLAASNGNYPPNTIKNSDGTFSGFNVEFFEQVSQLLNINLRLHHGVWAEVQKQSEKGELDGLAIVGKDPKRDALYNASDTIYPSYFSVFTNSPSSLQIDSFSDLNGLRIGYKRGARPAKTRLEKLPSATLVPFDSHESITQALLSKEIDVVVAWIGYDNWRKNTLQGTIEKIYLIKEYPLNMVVYFRKDWPEFIPIFNKAVAVLRQEQLPRLMNKWYGEWPQQKPLVSDFYLTPEEKAWLDQKHVVRVGVGDNPPWNINTPEPTGMSVEYLKWIGERFGINFEFIPYDQPWIVGFEDIAGEHKNFDLYPTAKRTPERLEKLAMSDDYLQSPWVVFTRDDVTDVYDIQDLIGKKIAVERGYVMQTQLTTTLPGIDLDVRDGTERALLSVSTKQADAYVGNLIVTSYLIERLGITNIKIACPTPFGMHSQAMATRKEWAPLISIINKGLSSMPSTEKHAIRSKYSSIRYEYGISSDEAKKWGLIVVLSVLGIITMFLVWNKQLSRRVAQRTAELADSEARFRATFEQAAVGIAHVSPEGRFLRLNKKFCDIVGYSEEEMHKLTFQDITHPDDLDKDLDLVQELLDGKSDSYTMEKRYLRKDGSAVWVNLTVKILRNEDGSPRWFVSVIEDITERVRARDEVKKSYEFLDHLTQAIPDAIFSVKLPERTVNWCADTYEVLGYEPKDCIGETTAKFYPSPDEEKQFGTLMENAVEEGKELVQTELRLRRKNGEIFPAEVKLAFMQEDDRVIGVTALVRDISERKEAEEKLQQSHDFFQYLLNSIPETVFYVKLPERVVVWINDSYNIMGLGGDPEHFKGLSTKSFFASEEDYERFGAVQRQAIEEGSPFMHTETMARHANGTVFPADVTGTFFKEEGKVTGITAIARDITEVKNAEKKFIAYQDRLKALTSQLTLAEENERRRIAENLHDEVSQALAMTRLQLAAASRGTKCDDPKLKGELEEISGSLLQAIRDTRQLIFELSSPAMHELGLGPAISEWVEEKKKKSENEVDITVDDKLSGNELDENERTILFRSIRELLNNAFKHARAKKINISLAADEETVQVTIKDDGIGFNPAQVMNGQHIDGGFGLFSIEERMKDLKGTMEVDAAPHRGCKVTLRLPRMTE